VLSSFHRLWPNSGLHSTSISPIKARDGVDGIVRVHRNSTGTPSELRTRIIHPRILKHFNWIHIRPCFVIFNVIFQMQLFRPHFRMNRSGVQFGVHAGRPPVHTTDQKSGAGLPFWLNFWQRVCVAGGRMSRAFFSHLSLKPLFSVSSCGGLIALRCQLQDIRTVLCVAYLKQDFPAVGKSSGCVGASFNFLHSTSICPESGPADTESPVRRPVGGT